ncbi:MAG: LamG domain-containing protein [Candidatus ainarchaeum sp.]|nr:LamG domain-containing protein [Candidatus ainarchaeum sp.]
MNFLKSIKAQGTIEYLVIIGVVVIVGLIVVALLTNFFDDAQNISTISTKISSITGVISVDEAVVDIDGNGLIALSNNSGRTITITKINIDDSEIEYSDIILTQGLQKIFSLEELGNSCSCTGFEGKTKICEMTIYYTSKYGLEKQFTTDIVVDCVEEAIPKNYDILVQPKETVPIQTRFVYFNSNENFLNGIFNYTKLGTIKQNGELDYNVNADYTYLSSDYNRDMNGLIAYYKFNSKDGTTIYDSANENNGTLVNGADTNAFGLWDTNAGYFDGVNDYVITPFDIGDFYDHSISVWVKVFTYSSSDHFITGGGWNFNSMGNIVYGENNKFGTFVCPAWNTCNYVWSNNQFNLNQWYFLTSTYDTASQTLSFYINGILQDTISSNRLKALGYTYYIGSRNPAWDEYLNGILDEVKIYNRVLSPEEIQKDYNNWFIDANYISPIIDTTSTTTDFNFIQFNSNNGIDINGFIYGSQIEPEIEIDLNNGLIGLWHLNESAGATSFDDAGPNTITGSCSGNCPTQINGLWETNASQFDGSQTPKINLGSLDDIIIGLDSFSTSGWIFLNNVTGNQNMIFSNTEDNYAQMEFYLASDQTLCWNFYASITGWAAHCFPGIQLNKWNHFTVIWDGSTVKAFINGLEKESIQSNIHTGIMSRQNTEKPMCIGNRCQGAWYTHSIDGKIDEIGFWDRALTNTEAKELFNKGSTKLGIKYRSCAQNDCSDGSWSSTNYFAGTNIDISELTPNQYFQWAVVLQQYQFPDGNYFPHAFTILKDVNLVYTN